MKNAILLLILSFVSTLSFAQCTPDPAFTNPGIYPDSATGFATAYVNVAYEQVVTNIVPEDTLVFGFPVPIDSIVIDDVTGLPPGMTLACNPNNCTFLGGTTGCAIVTGTCSVAGEYLLVFNLSAYAGGASTPNPTVVDYYTINVVEENSTPIIDKQLFVVAPNPFSNIVSIQGEKEINTIEIYNAQGQLIFNQFINAASVQLDLSTFEKGMYFSYITSVDGIEVVKLLKD